MKSTLFIYLLLPLSLLAQNPVCQQAKSFSATADMTNTAVVKAPGNGYFLTGYFTGTATFDDLTLSAGAQSGYLLKVDCDFKAEWVKIVGTPCNYATVDPQ